MKKIFAALLTLAMALSLTACNNRPADPAGMPADASVSNFSSSSSRGEASSTLSDEDKALLESVEIPSSVSSETTVTTSDGSTVTVRPDGSKTIEKADGSTVTVTSEGTVTTTPAGNGGGGTSHEPSSQSGGGASTPSSKAPSSSTAGEISSRPSSTPSSTPSSKPTPPPSSKPSETPKPDPKPSSTPEPPPPPPPSSAPDPEPPKDPSLAAYYYPYDTAQIKADMIAYGISRGLTLDTSLNLSNAGYDFPTNTKSDFIVPITDEETAKLFKQFCRDGMDYTIHQNALGEGLTDEEFLAGGMRFNIVVKTESDGSYSFYMPYG